MDKPNQKIPLSINSTPVFMPLNIPDPSIKGDSWDQLLENRGIRFKHYKAVPCCNMVSLETNGHRAGCPFCDNNGMLYYGGKIITAHFSSNSLQKMYEYQGVFEAGSAMLTIPTHYDDGTECDVNMFDKLEVLDFETRVWELLEYKPTIDGKQVLRYPIIDIEYMSAVREGSLVLYTKGTNFTISTEGYIKWITGKTPTYDKEIEVGLVLSISYICKPVYIVLQIMRELRVTNEMLPDGTKVARRLPQQVLAKKDFYLNAEKSKIR